MAAPVQLRHVLFLITTSILVSLSRAGPLGPMPNMTSGELGLNEGSCALGDVVYMPGDEFPGSTPCEKCMCAKGDVKCNREVCEPRPGCKALHRPDHCCPTYQCECEQEGRVYGNGEKLVDPVDPCRVCYCQGGEVVCRRIACFVRDDCSPRLVPGRCCPEYDNCPLRGVTSLPGLSSSASSIATAETDAPPAPKREDIKQKITIKEITPVSEIPVITEVKIKEILPSPSIEVTEYASSKAPLMPREATSERTDKEPEHKTESPSVIEVHLPSPASSPESTQFANLNENQDIDTSPSKFSFSTQDASFVPSSVYPSNVPIIATMGIPPVTSESTPVATTKAVILEEEDTFDHNPAFPPIPDDLSVLRNHEDEIVPEPNIDNEHVHDTIITSSPPPLDIKEEPVITSTMKDLPDTTAATTKETPKISLETLTTQPETALRTEGPTLKDNPMLNLRSAIATDIQNMPSIVSEELNGELDETTTIGVESIPTITTTGATITFQETTDKPTNSTENTPTNIELRTTSGESKITTDIKPPTEFSTITEELRTTQYEGVKITSEETGTSEGFKSIGEITSAVPNFDSITTTTTESEKETKSKEEEQTTSSIAKSNVATEVTSETELTSLPVETSNQTPPQDYVPVASDTIVTSTIQPPTTTAQITFSSEVITLSKATSNENTDFENIETTEFVLTSFGSSETTTNAVELIKISASPEKSAAIIEVDKGKKNNALADLISLVSDVASISDHTEEPLITQRGTTVNNIPNSEELIPVNAGYKSKNKNFNQNSITELPFKSKNPSTVNKQKIVEIEDDESEGVTDAPPPNDKKEPTTRRPIIDNVSDDNIAVSNKNKTKKDIEIIPQSYVPTISRKPTKVVMNENTDNSPSDDSSAVPTSTESTSDINIFNEGPLTTSVESSASAEMSSPIESIIAADTSSRSVEPKPSTQPQLHNDSDMNKTPVITETAQ